MIGERTFTNKTRSEDIACIMYAKLGFSINVIARNTGLSKGAISYRMRLLGVKLANYRNGESELAKRCIAAAAADSNRLMDQIRQHINKALPPPK